MSTIFNLCGKNMDADANNNGLLGDYVHNLSHNACHINDFEWYFNDNYYYDIAGNGITSENVRDVNSFNSRSSTSSSSSAFKTKNTVYGNEKVNEKKTKNPFELNRYNYHCNANHNNDNYSNFEIFDDNYDSNNIVKLFLNK